MFKKILYNIFPWLIFIAKQKEEISTPKKINAFVNSILSIWGFYMTVIVFLPASLYSNLQVHSKHFNFYESDSLSSKEKNKMQEIMHYLDNVIEKEPLYHDNTAVDIVDFENRLAYMFSNPINVYGYIRYKRFPIAITIFNRVITHDLNISNGLFYNLESIKATLHHEAIHTLQYKKYGYFHIAFMLPQWIREGYPVYRTLNESVRYNKKMIDHVLSTDQKRLTIAEKYLLWALMVKHSIEDMHISIDDLYTKNIDYDRVYHSLLKKYGKAT